MFVSIGFGAFLLIVLLVYYILPKRCQWVILLIANFMFYFAAGTTYPFYILFTATTVYLASIIIERYVLKIENYKKSIKEGTIEVSSREEKKQYIKSINKKKKTVLLLCLFLNIGLLAVIKYSDFLFNNIDMLFHIKRTLGIDKFGFIVPMGISFYTFQSIGYLLDVYWEKYKPQKNYCKFVLFISFFPQLIQGPISRYNNVSESLYKKHNFDSKRLVFGAQRILWGYFKKLVIADRLAIAVSMMVSDPEYYNGAFVPIYMVMYAVMLYADFSGGIDIALGCAECFGIKLDENFERPFFSKNIAEYWRRWHITMGTWFRDYVFYPFSISKMMKNITSKTKKHCGMKAARKAAVYLSTMVAWFATGIWHGAAWSYIAWGIVNGIVIIVSEECTPLYKSFHNKHPKLGSSIWYRNVQIIRTFILMCFIRMFDNYDSVKTSVKQVISIFWKFDLSKIKIDELLGIGLSIGDYIVVACGVLIMFLVSVFNRRETLREDIYRCPYIVKLGIFIIIIFAIILFGQYGIGYDSRQFIYNQF